MYVATSTTRIPDRRWHRIPRSRGTSTVSAGYCTRRGCAHGATSGAVCALQEPGTCDSRALPPTTQGSDARALRAAYARSAYLHTLHMLWCQEAYAMPPPTWGRGRFNSIVLHGLGTHDARALPRRANGIMACDARDIPLDIRVLVRWELPAQAGCGRPVSFHR